MVAPGDCNPLMGLGSMDSAALELLGVLVTADEDFIVMEHGGRQKARRCVVCFVCRILRCSAFVPAGSKGY